MKTTLPLYALAAALLLPLFASAQIDLTRISLTNDSTVSVRDTVYWQFDEATVTHGGKQVKLYQASLIVWQGGNRIVPITSGVRARREYLEFLRGQREQHAAEIATLTTALNGLRDRRTALVNEINRVP
jgi:hypothetical protein